MSLDDADSHRRFADKHGLPFSLLVDPDGTLAARYGVDTSKGYTPRVTFVIDRAGTIARVFPEVDIASHSADVLEVLRAL